MTFEFEGVTYEAPDHEPAQDRNPATLNPIFKQSLERYVELAQQFTRHEIRLGECRRSEERQLWLLAQGRANDEKERSWTLDSRHRWGLACDLILVDMRGKAVWDDEAWASLYEECPPEWFGLKHLGPNDWVHLELVAADSLIARAEELGLYQV